MNLNLEKGRPVWPQVRKYAWHYMIIIPVLLYYVVFSYLPMAGLSLAFVEYNPLKGFASMRWIGFKWFEYIFTAPDFLHALGNTVIINIYKLIFAFPAPILLALLFNECRSVFFKRTVQTISYLPHFISWSIIGGLLTNLFSPSTGLINQIIMVFGGEPIYFMSENWFVRGLLVGSDIWKGVGWGTILYLAALTNVNPELYEAATLDGAGKLKQTWHITIPSIMYLIVMQLIFTSTSLFDVGFDQALNLVNPATYDNGLVTSVYIYNSGIRGFNFGYPTAANMFQSVIALIMVLVSNGLARVFQPDGAIW